MKILLSAYACEPNIGSEPGVGWHYAVELAKDHQVCVLTDTICRPSIEAYGPLPPNLQIVYYRPNWLKDRPTPPIVAQMMYQVWQVGAVRVARELDAASDFDVVWHLTYGVFRQPSGLWRLGKPFVFGPVGGGERTPMRLRAGQRLPEQFKDLVRDILNRLAWWQPALWACVRHADLLLSRTPETQACFPREARERCVLQGEIGSYQREIPLSGEERASDAPLKVIYAGRLEGWKGVHFAVAAFAQFLAAGGKGEFVIVGAGPMESRLRDLIARHGAGEQVRIVGRLPQEELFSMYESFDLLLFPSLHDSGGSVVLEALSFGLPVICVDLGGPPQLVTSECAVVVPTRGIGPQELERRLAEELLRLYRDPQRLRAMRKASLARASTITWEKQVAKIMKLITQLPAVQQRMGNR